MNERNIELAIEAGFDGRREWPPMYKKFVDLIRADEREEILKLADSLGWVDVDYIKARGDK